MAEKSNEWYTPAKYVEAARFVMGGIDLDPASCELANRTVKAERYYSIEENGLLQPWHGRVWLNPPFGRLEPDRPGTTKSWRKLFTLKLWNEYHHGDVQEACMLTLGLVNKWNLPFWDYPTCIISDRADYPQPDGSVKSFGFGIVIVYLGPYEHKFVNTFSQFGRIAKAIDTPRRVEKPIPLWDVERIYA